MSSYTVERSLTVKSSAPRLRGLVDDFHSWTSWSPWEDLDPALERTYTGPEGGVGARYAWSGNRKAGQGSMEIIRSSPGEIAIALEFLKPFKSSSVTVFTFTPTGEETTVSWSMLGEQKGLMSVFSKVFSMEKLIGPDFEKGLARLKGVAESG
jgi:hypothetical protein